MNRSGKIKVTEVIQAQKDKHHMFFFIRGSLLLLLILEETRKQEQEDIRDGGKESTCYIKAD